MVWLFCQIHLIQAFSEDFVDELETFNNKCSIGYNKQCTEFPKLN